MILGSTSGFKGQYFQRVYTNLPSHSSIHFSFTFWLLDHWNSNQGDSFQIQFDSETFDGWTISENSFTSSLCGMGSKKDLPSLKVFGTTQHNSSSLTLRIISQLDQNSQIKSFGFRDVSLLFVNSSLTSSSSSMCGIAPITLPNNQCACPEGNYESPVGSGTCQVCNSSCASCFGPSSSECYQCAPGKFFDGVECITCHSSCSVCFGSASNQCNICKPGYYLLNNNTCIPTCDSPLVQTSDGLNNFCEGPCNNTDMFIYQNGACLSSCDFPLTQSTQEGFKVCIHPCNSTNNEFLYWNGSCKTSCNFPYVSRVKDNIKYCNYLCLASEYLLLNGSCISSCNPPMRNEVSNNQRICNLPCGNPSDYYYEDDKICLSYCNQPDEIKVNEFYNSCKTSLKLSSIQLSEEPEVRAAAVAADAGSRVMTATITLASVLGSSNPATFGLAGFVKMLPYIRYMNIQYPPRLELLLNSMNSTIISFSFGPSIPSEVEPKFQKYPLPGKFDEYGLHSSFVVNFWQNFGALLIILLVIIGLNILCIITKRFPTLGYIFTKLKLVVKWNFFLMIFCTNLDGVVLSTSLEMRTLQVDSFLSSLSLIFCIVMNIITFAVFYLIFHIVRDFRKYKSRISPQPLAQPIDNHHHNKTLQKWEDFQCLYVGSKEDSLIQHIFMLPFLLRLYFFNLIIAYLFTYPLFQTILIVLLGVFMLVYMIWKKPFKSNLVFCQHTTDELTILVINISILCLASLDSMEMEALEVRETLGDVIIIANIIFSITSNIYLAAYLYVGIKSAIAKVRKEKKTGFVAFFIALLAPFEAGGMDVEVNSAEPAKIVPVINIKNEEISSIKITIQEELPPLTDAGDSRRRSIQMQTFLSDSEISPNNFLSGKNLLRPFEKLEFPIDNRLLKVYSPRQALNSRIQRRSHFVSSFRDSLFHGNSSGSAPKEINQMSDRTEGKKEINE